MILVKQLAFENANSTCQAAIRPFKRKGNLSNYIRLCADIGPAYVQGLSMATALQGKSVKDILFQQQKRQQKGRTPGPPGSYFNCGQMGHFSKNCPRKACRVMR